MFVCLALCRLMSSCSLHHNSAYLTMRSTIVQYIAFMLQIDIYSITHFIIKEWCGVLLRNYFPGKVWEGHVYNLYVTPLPSCYIDILFVCYIHVELSEGIYTNHCCGRYLAPCHDNEK